MWTLFLWEKNGFKSNVSAIFVEIHRIPLLNKPIFPHFVWFLENNETRFMNLIAWVELTLLRTSVSLLLTIYTEIDREIVVDSVLIYTHPPPFFPTLFFSVILTLRIAHFFVYLLDMKWNRSYSNSLNFWWQHRLVHSFVFLSPLFTLTNYKWVKITHCRAIVRNNCQMMLVLSIGNRVSQQTTCFSSVPDHFHGDSCSYSMHLRQMTIYIEQTKGLNVMT